MCHGGASGKYTSLKPFETEINSIFEKLRENDEYFNITTEAISNAYNKAKETENKQSKDDVDSDKSTFVNKKGSFMSLLLQTAENQVLENIIEYLEINGYIEDNNVSLIFDGCQITKDPTIVLGDIEKYVLEQTKYDIKLKVKPFDECLKLPDNYAEDIDENIALVDFYNSRINEFVERHNDMIEVAIRNEGSHNHIAEICCKFFGDALKYDTKTECWYYCDVDNIWKKDKKGLLLSKMIPKIISKIFTKKVAMLYQEIPNDNNNSIQQKITGAVAISLKLNNDGFVKSVINRCLA